MRKEEFGEAINWDYIIISVTMVAIFTILALYMPKLAEFDRKILHSIISFLSPYPAYVPAFFTDFGRAFYMFWPQLVGVSVLASHRQYAKAFLLVLFTQGAYFLSNMISNYVGRTAPNGEWAGFCFPSLQVATTVTLYGIMIFLLMKYAFRGFVRYFSITVLGLFIFMNAISCMWLNYNYLTDVLAGAFLGFLFVNLYVIITRRIEK